MNSSDYGCFPINMHSPSDVDTMVVRAELLKGTQPFYEAVEDAKMYYRDDGHQPGPNTRDVMEAVTTVRKHYPGARKHLTDLYSSVDSSIKHLVQILIQELDEAEKDVEELAKDVESKGGLRHKAGGGFQLSSTRLAKSNNKKMFCCFVIFLILLGAVMAGAAWCRSSKCHRMKW